MQTRSINDICNIIKNKLIKDENNGLYEYKEIIIKYFVENKIDGTRFILLVKDQKQKMKFVEQMKNYFNSKDDKLDKLLAELLDDIMKVLD